MSSPAISTAPPLPAGGEFSEGEHRQTEAELEAALVPAPLSGAEEGFLQLSEPVALLPVEMDVAVPVRNFRVRNLLALAPGHVVESQWNHGGDVPLMAGDVQLAWSEFEVIETELAVRITRLA